MAKRGGALIDYFRSVDPITGASKITTLSIVLIFVLIVLVLLAVILPLTLGRDKDQEEPKESKKTGPPMSGIPGRITIAEVAQAPSAGQAIMYFSQAEASGTTCESCTAEFDVNITYSGGRPVPPPQYKKLTAPALSGTVTFEYSVPTQTGGSTRPDVEPPNQMDITVHARSVNTQTGQIGGATSFSKTLPYIA